MTDAAAGRLQEIIELAAQAEELLDRAVGRSARMRGQNRELVRTYLLSPRNHLRASLATLRQQVEEASRQRETDTRLG